MAPSEGKRLLCLGKQLNYVWSVSELDKKKKLRSKKIAGIRGWIQAAATLLTNPHIPNFFQGKIYQGKAKTVCVPGLNCYSCPAATGACPIGAFQAVVGSSKFKFSYYITGFLILLGVTLGRFICGFLCPFGWFQDLLHKIPGKKFSTARLKPLRYLKYIILVVFVILLPMFATNSIGMGDPFFCKYICPQGVLEGAIPLSIGNAAIRSALGKLFSFKFCILITVVVLSILFYRPFCKWICPLGAIYSLFNKVSFLHITIENSKCVGCNQCSRACKMDIDVCRTPNHPECIRCGACIKACPKDAIHYQFLGKTCQKRTPEINSQRSETIDQQQITKYRRMILNSCFSHYTILKGAITYENQKNFYPCFYTQRSIITYRMQRKRGCRHKENADNTDGIRHRSCYGICCGIRNRNGRLPAQSWTIYISRKTRFLQIMRMYGIRCLA